MNGVLDAALSHVGAISLLFTRTVKETVRRKPEWSVILDQMHHLGVRSLAIATVTALFTGMVLALQTSYSLAAYGAKLFVGDIVALSLVRELGPVLTALMVGGRVGAGITAEIGSMKVTEEVLALETIGINPVGFLVAPRFLAMTIMLPALTIFSVVLGILGGWALGAGNFGMSTGGYFDSARDSLVLKDFVSAGVKSVLFGWIVALIACYRGLIVEGGPEEVGRATMEAVVSSMVLIVVVDFFVTGLFYYSFYLFKVPIL